MRSLLLLVTAAVTGCAMPFEFGLDLEGFRTVVATELPSPDGASPTGPRLEHRPRLFDTSTDELSFVGPAEGRYVVAMWPEAPSELGLDANTIRASTGDFCDSFEVRLDTVEALHCVLRGVGDIPCKDWDIGPSGTRKLGVVSGNASACDPGFMPLANFTLVNLDVQSGTIAVGAFEKVSAGRATIVAPLGDGRVVLGQYSAKQMADPAPTQDTELATYLPPTSNTSTAPLPYSRVRTSTLWSAGSKRDGDSVWLGSSTGRLAYYTYRTDQAATISDVIDRSPQVGSIVELVAHGEDPERIYAASSACGLFVREPGAARWTTLVAPLPGLLRRVPVGEGCAPRIAMIAPRLARVVGIPYDPNGNVTPMNYGDRTAYVLSVDGQQVTAQRPPWPSDDAPMQALRGVVVFEQTPGSWMEAVMGSEYMDRPEVLAPPYDFGRGTSWVFLRRAGSDEPWAPVQVASVFDGESTAEPILFGDAAPVTVQDGQNVVRGFVAGAHLRLHVFDVSRYQAKLNPAMAAYGSLWHSTGSYPFASRVRDDGSGGIVFGSGDDNDAHAEFPKRFHWLRPRR